MILLEKFYRVLVTIDFEKFSLDSTAYDVTGVSAFYTSESCVKTAEFLHFRPPISHTTVTVQPLILSYLPLVSVRPASKVQS